MVSHIGSICEKCGSDKYHYMDNEFKKRQVLATTCFVFAFIAVLYLFIGLFWAAILGVITIITGVTLARKVGPVVSVCNNCHAHGTMHAVNTPKGQELYKKYYEKK